MVRVSNAEAVSIHQINNKSVAHTTPRSVGDAWVSQFASITRVDERGQSCMSFYRRGTEQSSDRQQISRPTQRHGWLAMLG